MIRVSLSGQLKSYTGGARHLDVDGPKTVLGLVQDLDVKFPGIKDRILDNQETIRRYVNVFVNGEDVRGMRNEGTPLRDGDSVHILPSIAGG